MAASPEHVGPGPAALGSGCQHSQGDKHWPEAVPHPTPSRNTPHGNQMVGLAKAGGEGQPMATGGARCSSACPQGLVSSCPGSRPGEPAPAASGGGIPAAQGRWERLGLPLLRRASTCLGCQTPTSI